MGKGCRVRTSNWKKLDENWDKIKWTKDKETKKEKKVSK